ncbi:hypothetical protein DRW42_19060 [Pedobacter miscanthi]|uniref:Uncharacterized protein n=1 Tax=Pedobacter miscanthi TaxID=2259170 RepID=A0A366KS07_9SPHI|nr:hypothetical protein DRW42_19060 [Pedobacter miscanthi]
MTLISPSLELNKSGADLILYQTDVPKPETEPFLPKTMLKLTENLIIVVLNNPGHQYSGLICIKNHIVTNRLIS